MKQNSTYVRAVAIIALITANFAFGDCLNNFMTTVDGCANAQEPAIVACSQMADGSSPVNTPAKMGVYFDCVADANMTAESCSCTAVGSFAACRGLPWLASDFQNCLTTGFASYIRTSPLFQ